MAARYPDDDPVKYAERKQKWDNMIHTMDTLFRDSRGVKRPKYSLLN